MPSNCLKSDSGEYLIHHNPMPYYTNLGSDCSNFDVPFGPSPDLSASFTFITPNGLHSMVDGTIAQGDSFLSSYVPALIATPQYQAGNTAIFITWDEDEDPPEKTGPQGCCGFDPNSPANFGGGHIPTIVITNHGPRGLADDTPYNHYSLLRTTEDAFCIREYLGHADDAAAGVKSMRQLFQTK